MKGTAFCPTSGFRFKVKTSNVSWKAARHIAQKLGLQLSVTFEWREKEGAAFPGVTGHLSILAT